MRAGHWVSWLSFLVLAASQDDVDSEQSRKVLGSSVVTSVSVIMDHGNGTKTYIADAAGQPVAQNEGPVGSPGELLSPDRYEFYTFDESGDLVKRLMTLDQIQGLIAGGDNDAMDSDATAPIYYHENLPTDSNGHMDVTDMEISDVQGVHNVVASVQNVLKSELEATQKKPSNKPLAVLNMPDAASSWSILLPGVLGAGDGSMMAEDAAEDMERITLTEAINKTESTTITSTAATTITKTTEEPSTVKYVTKRPTDSPTVVHYLPIQNIPTKKPGQMFKVSEKPSVSRFTVAPSTTTSSTIPAMEELSASLYDVLAQVSIMNVDNHTAVDFVPVITTEITSTKAPEKNSIENIDEKSNIYVNKNATTVDKTVINSTFTGISSSPTKNESLEAQSSNDNTQTTSKTTEELIERRKPSTIIDQSLNEFISTTISGSDFSIKPIQIDSLTTSNVASSTVKPLSNTTSNMASSTVKPLSSVSKPNTTSNPLFSNSAASELASSENPIISYQSITTKNDLKGNSVEINKTDEIKPPTNNTYKLENSSVNTELRSASTTIKPTELESSTSDEVLTDKPNEVSVLTELVTSSSNLPSQNTSVLPKPVKYNTTTIVNTDRVEVPTSTEALINDKTNTPTPELSTSQKHVDKTKESITTESIISGETYPASITLTADKYDTSESKLVTSKTNTTASATNVTVTSQPLVSDNKPIKPTADDFTITTYKPSTNQPIKISTNQPIKISTNQPIRITTNINKSTLTTPQSTEKNQPLDSNSKPDVKSGTAAVEVKLKTAGSHTVASTTNDSTNTVPVVLIPLINADTTESTMFITTVAVASETESIDNNLNMENEASVHESISAVTNILLEDKPNEPHNEPHNEPPNEPQIPLPTIADFSGSPTKEPKLANGELKHALNSDEDDDKSTTETNESSTVSTTDGPDSTTVFELFTTESANKDGYNVVGSNDSNENITDELNSSEVTTESVTTIEDDVLTTPDESIENTSTLSTTIQTEQKITNESTIIRTVMQAIPTKESKLNPDQVTDGESTNIHLLVEDSVVDVKETIITDNNASDYTTREPVLISSSNDKKEPTPQASTTENISTVKLEGTTFNKVDKESVTEKIALKTVVKPDDTKSHLLKRPATQNAYRPLPAPPLTPPTAVELHPAPHESMGLEASTAFLGDDVRRFSDLCNELAFRMWTSITGKGSITSRSLVFSPFSATSLLAMVFLGARGPTSGQMNDILRLDDMVTFNPHQVLQNITESVLNSRNYGVATAAFIRELYSDKVKGKILDFYKERAQQYYDGHVEEVAFNVIGDILRRRTNLLVKRQTLGRIPEYLRGSGLNLRPPLAAFSANIFQTDCEQASIDGRDGEMYFVVRPSTRQRRLVPVPAAVWRSGFLAGYEPGLDATAVSLGADTVVSTLLVLPGQQGQVAPGDGLARLEQRLIETSYRRGGWSRLLRSLLPRPGLELQVPRFSHRSVLNVTGALQRMGLKDLFNEGRADLRGLNGLSNELHLSDMVQVNTFSTCGEEAIGARHHVETYPVSPQRMGRDEPELYPDFEDDDSIFMSIPLSLRPRQARLPDNPRLRFDRPFLYMVRHNPTGMILYMGRFNPRLLP